MWIGVDSARKQSHADGVARQLMPNWIIVVDTCRGRRHVRKNVSLNRHFGDATGTVD